MKRGLLLLAFAALLPLTGCKKIEAYYHRWRLKHHEEQVAAAAAAQATPAAAATPQPSAAAFDPLAQPPPPSVHAINKSAGCIVLLYHRFEENPSKKAQLVITPEEFDSEMAQIKQNGFTVIPLQDFLAWRRGEKNIPAKSCVITIDDGYVSGYDTAWPILKKYGYPFTVFVYINYINSGGKSISWDQLGEMRDAGVDIECHTYSHSDLRDPGVGVDKKTHDLVAAQIKQMGMDGWLRHEIIDSKKLLETQLGIKVDAIAYPFGKYSAKVRELVKEAGYEAAFGVYGQRNGFSAPPYDVLGRYAIDQNSLSVFKDAMAMSGGGSGGEPPTPDIAQMASVSMVTEPAENSTINNSRPLIRANLATMGAVDPTSVRMRISGIGPVPATYDPKTKIVSYQVAQPLTESGYTVILSAIVDGKQAETRWSFNFNPAAAPDNSDMVLPPKPPQ